MVTRSGTEQAGGAVDAVRERLRACGIAPTRQRTEIARVLLGRSQHLSAEQLMVRLEDEGRMSVSKATVYNTLKLFARAGLVREVLVDPSKVFYDSNTSNHHHLYDVRTGALTDFASDAVRFDGLPALPDGAVVEGVDVVVRVRTGRD